MRPRDLLREPARACRTGAGVVMLRVIETDDRNQQWLGVADIMRRAKPMRRPTAALDQSRGARQRRSPASRRSA